VTGKDNKPNDSYIVTLLMWAVMSLFRIAALCLCLSLSACVATTERVTLVPGPRQEFLPSNGHEWLASRQKVTAVGLIHPPGFARTGKWVPFALQIRNKGLKPIEVRVTDASVLHKGAEREVILPIKTFGEIEEGERKRHEMAEFVEGSLAYANVSLAMQARSGVGQARPERRETMEALEREHLQNMQVIRQYALRDHTLSPGGVSQALIFVEAPEALAGERHYAIRIKLGEETHEFGVVQTAPK
jgi:hypothetical protein